MPLLDPRTRRPVSDAGPASLDGVALLALCMETAPLQALSAWEPAGSLLETLFDATRGHGGLTVSDVARLRTWSANYSALAPTLAEFLARHHETPEGSAALWWVLGTSAVRPSSIVERGLRDLWTEETGAPPSIELLPRPNHRTPHRSTT